MKTLMTLALTLIVLAISQTSDLKADDLFSNSGLQNVYKNTQQTAPTTQTANNKITENDLGQFIKAMGYQVKDLGDNIYLIQIKQAEWTFEPVISLSKGGTRIWVNIALKTYKSSSSLNAPQLMKLLDANLTYGPAVFNYSLKNNRISLTRSFRNNNLMPADMKSTIIDMCKIAIETTSLWNVQESSTTPSPQQTTPVPQQTKKPVQPYWLQNVSLEKTPVEKKQAKNPIGRWKSNEFKGQIFDLKFNPDGNYLYIYTKSQEKTEVNGKFSINGNILTMVSNSGNTLEGRMV